MNSFDTKQQAWKQRSVSPYTIPSHNIPSPTLCSLASDMWRSRQHFCRPINAKYSGEYAEVEVEVPWSTRNHGKPDRLMSHHHDDVIKWKYFPRYWPFVRGIHRSPVNSPHKGQWRGALFISLICAWINGWVNTSQAGDLRRIRAHYDVIVMMWPAYGVYKKINMAKQQSCLTFTRAVLPQKTALIWDRRTPLAVTQFYSQKTWRVHCVKSIGVWHYHDLCTVFIIMQRAIIDCITYIIHI